MGDETFLVGLVFAVLISLFYVIGKYTYLFQKISCLNGKEIMAKAFMDPRFGHNLL